MKNFARNSEFASLAKSLLAAKCTVASTTGRNMHSASFYFIVYFIFFILYLFLYIKKIKNRLFYIYIYLYILFILKKNIFIFIFIYIYIYNQKKTFFFIKKNLKEIIFFLI